MCSLPTIHFVKSNLLKFALLFCLAAALARAGESWGGLRVGMKAAEVQRLVGEPLLATTGHGYVRWCFDHLGDVVFYRGVVVSWTRPVRA